jgi:hypothetical protein
MTENYPIAVSCGERWSEITRVPLPEHEIMRIKGHLSGMNDDDLVYTAWFGPLEKAIEGKQDTRLVIVGADGAGRRLRREFDAQPEEILDDVASVYLCTIASNGDEDDLRYVVIDAREEDDRILICRRESFLDVFNALEEPSTEGSVWMGKRAVSPNEWESLNEDDYLFADGLVDAVHESTGEFLRSGIADMYRAWDMPPRRGVLLHGEPGNGKTVLSRIAAKRALAAGVNVVFLTVSSLDRGIVGNLELAASRSPVLIVIDDLDVHCGIRSNDAEGQPVATPRQRFLAGMLEFLDGVSSADGYVLLATTNAINALDPALLRPGRLDVHIEVPKPSDDHRRRLLEHNIELLDGSRPEVTGALKALGEISYAEIAEMARRYKIAVITHHGEPKVDQELLDVTAADFARERKWRSKDEAGPSFEE